MSSAATHPEGTAAPTTSSHRLPMAYAPRQSPRTQRQRPTNTDPTRSMANIQERSTGSATQTETPTAPSSKPLILRLRGAHDATPQTRTTRRRRIQWAEDVVDNEGLGRKKSKVCCIYHKNREVGESSSEDDSSDSDCCSSSGEDRDGGAKMAGGGGARRKGRARSPNAYEKMPKHGHNHEHKETEKEGT